MAFVRKIELEKYLKQDYNLTNLFNEWIVEAAQFYVDQGKTNHITLDVKRQLSTYTSHRIQHLQKQTRKSILNIKIAKERSEKKAEQDRKNKGS
jgi:hypothetical protein